MQARPQLGADSQAPQDVEYIVRQLAVILMTLHLDANGLWLWGYRTYKY